MGKKIVILGGDGVGPEVAASSEKVLKAMDLDLEIEVPLCGEQGLAEVGNFFPDDTKALCDGADAILFGACGDVSPLILGYLRWIMDNYVNIRPVKYYPGAKTPLKDAEGIDFVILREGIEGLYPGREGDLSELVENMSHWKDALGRGYDQYGKGKYAVRVISEKGSDRFTKFACEFTQARKENGYPGELICVTKANVLKQTDGFFFEFAKKNAAKYPDLNLQEFYVDDMARRILRYNKELDVVATTNMFGDILSDEAAELVGGLGFAASACVGGKVPYFEPVHGSAPKYAGKDVINPTAMLLSTVYMLDHLKMEDAARALEDAIAKVYREGNTLTQDQGGSAKCSEFTQAVIRNIG